MNWFAKTLTAGMFVASLLLAGAADPVETKPADGAEKHRESLQKLSPEEREAKMKEWRKTNGAPSREEWEKRREAFQKMTPEEREAKRKEIKERLEKRITELRSKQTNAVITAQESRELARSEQILKRFEQNAATAAAKERSKGAEQTVPEQK